MGAFFTLGATVFILAGLYALGCFDNIKINIMGIYIGIVCLVVGIGIILFQNGTTGSFMETVKSFGLWILIPFMFIIVGIQQLIKWIFLDRKGT